MNYGHSHHFQEMLAKSAQIGPQAANEPLATGRRFSLRRAWSRTTVQRTSIGVVICSYLFIVIVVLWIAFALKSRVTPLSRNVNYERTCVVMTRHKVKPTTPAIDSVRGGSMEPFAFGSVAFDFDHEEVTWNISDSLAVEPHELAIRGPLDAEHTNTAPVHIMLGVQRDAAFRLSGSAMSPREKISQIKQDPSKYYLSVREELLDGSVRELVRDTLDKPCKPGVK